MKMKMRSDCNKQGGELQGQHFVLLGGHGEFKMNLQRLRSRLDDVCQLHNAVRWASLDKQLEHVREEATGSSVLGVSGFFHGES